MEKNEGKNSNKLFFMGIKRICGLEPTECFYNQQYHLIENNCHQEYRKVSS